MSTSSLHDAAKNNCLLQTKWILMEEPEMTSARDSNLFLPIHIAARYASYTLVSALAASAPLTLLKTNIFGDTALHVAALYANVDAIRALLEANPDVLKITNVRGNTPLHQAAASTRGRRHEAFRILFEHGRIMAIKGNHQGDTPMHIAAQYGNTFAVQLMAQDVPHALYTANTYGMLPLHTAIERYVDLPDMCSRERSHSVLNQRDVVIFLLSTTDTTETMRQLNTDRITNVPREPSILHAAAYLGHERLTRLIMDRDSSALYELDSCGNYPIHLAASNGAVGIVRAMLEAVPSLAYYTNAMLETPLHCAASSSSKDVVVALLEHAPQLASQTMMDGCTPIYQAAASDNLGGLEALLRVAPAAAFVPDVNGYFPIYVAAWFGRRDAVDMLMRVAPETAGVTVDSFNALHAAVEQMWEEAVDVLLAHSPDLARSLIASGDNALHLAVRPEVDEDGVTFKEDELVSPIVRSLLRVSRDLAMQPARLTLRPGASVDGCLPLHVAAALGMNKCVDELLVAAPEAVFARNSAGHTPLQFALLNGHTCTADQLLRAPLQDPRRLLCDLNRWAPNDVPELYHTVICNHVPLPSAHWDLIPSTLPGSLVILRCVLTRGKPFDVSQLLARVSRDECKHMTTVLGCLRSVAPTLPIDIVQRIVADSAM